MPSLTPNPQYLGAVRKLEEQDYAVPETWNAENQKLIDQDAWLKARIEALQSGAELNAGAVTDAKIGSRTANQALSPTGDTGTLSDFINWFANRLKALGGGSSWRDAPAVSAATTKAHIDATTAHGATDAPTASRLMLRNASGQARVGTPTLPDHIARLQDVSDASAGVTGF